MKTKTTMFAVPIVGIIVWALMQPVGAQTYTYSRTITSYGSPAVVERIVEDPVIVENNPILVERIQRPVTTIERPVVIEDETVAKRPLVIEKETHHAFDLGIFPLGRIELF